MSNWPTAEPSGDLCRPNWAEVGPEGLERKLGPVLALALVPAFAPGFVPGSVRKLAGMDSAGRSGDNTETRLEYCAG